MRSICRRHASISEPMSPACLVSSVLSASSPPRLPARIADRRGPHFVVWLGALLTLAAWIIFGLWGSIPALVIGVIVLDFGIQSALVSNQHIVYALDQEARSRLNTIFMTSMLLRVPPVPR